LVVFYLSFSAPKSNISNLLNPKAARNTFFFPKPLFCVISIYLLLFYQKIRGRGVFLFFNIYGLFISGSRTYVLLMFAFIVGGYINPSKKNIFTISCLFFIIYLIFYFSGRFDNVFSELTFTSLSSVEDIGSQYRGFESFKALEKIFSGSIIEWLFGFGLNENISLDIDLDLGGFNLSEIPVLHNGFLYLIFRLGLIGFLFYLLFFYKILVGGFKNYSTHEKYMLLLIVFSLLMANIVIGSFYNMEFSIAWFLIGYYSNRK
jgi:hypothetical protein